MRAFLVKDFKLLVTVAPLTGERTRKKCERMNFCRAEKVNMKYGKETAQCFLFLDILFKQ